MKKEYITPSLETIQFDIADIITHSNAIDDGSGVNKPRPRGESDTNTVAIFATGNDMIVN